MRCGGREIIGEFNFTLKRDNQITYNRIESNNRVSYRVSL